LKIVLAHLINISYDESSNQQKEAKMNEVDYFGSDSTLERMEAIEMDRKKYGMEETRLRIKKEKSDALDFQLNDKEGYYYFLSRDNLLEAFLDRDVKFLEKFAEAVREDDGCTALRLLKEKSVELCSEKFINTLC